MTHPGDERLDPRHEAVGRFYDDAAYEFELTRLEARGPVERAMTERYLARFIPPGSTVVDAGVGAGHYAEFLARRGCRLHLVDVSARLLDTAGARLDGAGLTDHVIEARLASATALPHLADGSCDAVLLLGPLYHLLTLAEREQAVREARRVLKPGGVLAAAAVSRLAGLASAYYLEGEDGAVMLDEYRAFLADGLVDPELAPTIGRAHFSTSAEFRALFTDGFDELLFVGLESITGSRQTLFLDFAPDVRQAWLDLVEESAAEPEAIGLSEHFLFVGRRRARPEARGDGPPMHPQKAGREEYPHVQSPTPQTAGARDHRDRPARAGRGHPHPAPQAAGGDEGESPVAPAQEPGQDR